MRRSLSAFLLLALVSSFAARPASAETASLPYFFWKDASHRCVAPCNMRPIWCCPCIIEIPIFTPFGPV